MIVLGREGESYLTLKEADCVRLMRAGLSTKEVASLLEISSRSVETYLNRIKLRTGITNRLDILICWKADNLTRLLSGLNLSLNHPSIALEATIQERVKRFLEMHGFTFFQYIHCDLAGKLSLSGNYNLVIKNFAEKYPNDPFVFTQLPEDFLQSSSYSMLWEGFPNELPISLAAQKGYFHGMNVLYRYKGYYEMFVVGLPNKLENSGSFYLNKHAALERFFLDFKLQNQDLLNTLYKNPIQLKKSSLPSHHSDLCLQNSRFLVRGRYGDAYLTGKEMKCLRLIPSGISIKEMATFLNISPRSVETYLQRIKDKTGILTRSELISLNIKSTLKTE